MTAEKTNNNPGFSLFPKLSGEQQKRVRRSYLRTYYLIGAIPVIFGVMQSTNGILIKSILPVITGIIWLIAIVGFDKTNKKEWLYAILALYIVVIAGIFYTIYPLNALKIMDWVIVGALSLYMVYSGLALRRQLIP